MKTLIFLSIIACVVVVVMSTSTSDAPTTAAGTGVTSADPTVDPSATMQTTTESAGSFLYGSALLGLVGITLAVIFRI